MKTHTKTRMAMGLVTLMSLFLFGCTQYSTAGKMDTPKEDTMTETTEQNMGNTMDTMENKTMKTDMGDMSGQKMKDSMDTMKGGTMPGTMDTTKDKMMPDSSEEMMK